MRKEYDFSKARRNPYVKQLKRQVTIRIDRGTIAYFRTLSEETGIRYQTLINWCIVTATDERDEYISRIRCRNGAGDIAPPAG